MVLKEANAKIWELVDVSRSKEELVRILVASFSNPRSFDTYGIKNYFYAQPWMFEGGGDPPEDYDQRETMAREMLALAIKYIISDISIDPKTTQDLVRRAIILFQMLLEKATEMAVYWTIEAGDLKILQEDFSADPQKYFNGYRRMELDEDDESIFNDPMFSTNDLDSFKEKNLKDINQRRYHAESQRDLSKFFITDFEEGIKQLQTLLDQYIDAGIGSKYSNHLKWVASDTDLLEVVVAMWEKRAIQGDNQHLTKKDAIEAFSEFFQHNISYAESKASKMFDRKKGVHPFLDSLSQCLDDNAERLLGK
ncbi:MAG: RteC domain-containing protein [Bacteroidota bacterium]